MREDRQEKPVWVSLLDSGNPRSVERCGAGALARGRPPGRPASRRTRASAAVQGDRPTKFSWRAWRLGEGQSALIERGTLLGLGGLGGLAWSIVGPRGVRRKAVLPGGGFVHG